MDKTPPASAGAKGLIPGLGASHRLWSNGARAPVAEPKLQGPGAASPEALVPRTTQRDASAPQPRAAPDCRN